MPTTRHIPLPPILSRRGGAVHRCRLVVAWLLVAVTGEVSAATIPVSVTKKAPRIAYRSYDPLNPPAEMSKKLTLPEAGLCDTEFGCEIYTGTEMPRYRLGPVQATITSIRLILHLDITIWTVNAAPPKLHAHEEAHRRISEAFYRNADTLAYRLGAQALGKKLPVAPVNRESSNREAVEAFQGTLLAEYLQLTSRDCTVAQGRFDVLTAHGGNAITEDAALRQTLAEHPPGK